MEATDLGLLLSLRDLISGVEASRAVNVRCLSVEFRGPNS